MSHDLIYGNSLSPNNVRKNLSDIFKMRERFKMKNRTGSGTVSRLESKTENPE